MSWVKTKRRHLVSYESSEDQNKTLDKLRVNKYASVIRRATLSLLVEEEWEVNWINAGLIDNMLDLFWSIDSDKTIDPR